MFPFHTWLPDAHVEAPTPISVILAGILLKMGGYGFIRICLPIFPDATKYFALPIAILALISIIYGAYVAMAQTDLKKMVAYSSVNHMGYVMLAIVALTATGMNGAILQMFNHGIITGALFLLVGVLYDRAHTRDINAFGGLGVNMPIYAGIMMFFSLASLGLPGLAGFISEFLCFLGAFPTFKIITILAVFGVLITAIFFLRMLQKIFMGELNPKWAHLPRINKIEILSLAPLIILTVLIGVYPKIALDLMNITIMNLISRLGGIN
jgi:NADH-quinone oxidoreductase subunit M